MRNHSAASVLPRKPPRVKRLPPTPPRTVDNIGKIWYIFGMKCDLHIHSNCSDGIFSPEEIVDMAKNRGLNCISITDHDTFGGSIRAQKYAQQVGMKFVVGAELSAVAGQDVHILAYNIDVTAPEFTQEMQVIAQFRDVRNAKIVEKLNQLGMAVDLDALRANGSVGRAVIAREMVRLGYCKDVPEAFDKYLGTGKSCFVNTRRLTPVEAIRFTLRFGGIPVLAHPKQLRLNPVEFEKFLKPLVLSGLGGIEANYFTHNSTERKFYTKMAKKYKLIVTGGSDFHDYTHGVELGAKSFSPTAYTRIILGI